MSTFASIQFSGEEMEAGLGALGEEHLKQLNSELRKAGAAGLELVGADLTIQPYHPGMHKTYGRAFIRFYRDTLVYRRGPDEWQYRVDELIGEPDFTEWQTPLEALLDERAQEGWEPATYARIPLILRSMPHQGADEALSQDIEVLSQVVIHKRRG